jgi:GNAT superfamily N-acetyltransferase
VNSGSLPTTDAAPSLRTYRATSTLRDGSPIIVRAIRPEDKAVLSSGIRRLSEASVYHRFLGSKKQLSESELRYLTELDFVRHVGLLGVIERGGAEVPVGVGRFIRLDHDAPPFRAEVAFTVLDAWQGQGVATALLDHLARIARSLGIARFEADVLADNTQMMEVFEHSGLPISSSVRERVRRVVMRLAPE